MRSLTSFIMAASLFAVLANAPSAVQAADPQQPAVQTQISHHEEPVQEKAQQAQEPWRYTFHNGEWWYWLPTNQWVFWRDNRWNDYNPQTYVYPQSGVAPCYAGQTAFVGYGMSSGSAGDSDNRPFYGHALSSIDRRTLESSSETGPFYGHTLPGAVARHLVRAKLEPPVLRPRRVELRLLSIDYSRFALGWQRNCRPNAFEPWGALNRCPGLIPPRPSAKLPPSGR